MSLYVDIEKRLGTFLLRTKFEADDEVLALLGASGCGKSMTLKCIAGVVKPDKGKIILNGRVLFDSDKHINLPVQERKVGLLFQNYALFPNMTVLQNVSVAVKKEKNKEIRNKRIMDMIDAFGLSEVINHYPAQLSGGQQQRTALARILLAKPEILLLDEPFTALDSHLRFHLEQELRKVIKNFNKSVILVSHNKEEVFRLADKVAIMKNGSIDSCDTKMNIFMNPTTISSAILTGCRNISKVEWIDERYVKALDWNISFEINGSNKMSHMGIRAQDIMISDEGYLCEVVEEIENPYSYTLLLNSTGNSLIECEVEKEKWKSIRNDTITISFPHDKLILLNE